MLTLSSQIEDSDGVSDVGFDVEKEDF